MPLCLNGLVRNSFLWVEDNFFHEEEEEEGEGEREEELKIFMIFLRSYKIFLKVTC